MTDLQAAYRGVRERLTAVVRDAGPEAAATVVPATPDWTVKDVVAHLVGILADVRDGNLSGQGTDDWTARQVNDRRDRDLSAVLDEWTELAGVLEPTIPDFPPAMVAPLITDAYTHEQDVRGALGTPGARDDVAGVVALDMYLARLGDRLSDRGLALRVVTGGGDRVLGAGDPTATVRGEAFDLLRAATGRRSADQIRALDWDGDPAPFVEVFSTYPMRSSPLDE